MSQYLELPPQNLATASVRYAARKERKPLLRTFWITVIIIFFVAGFTINTPSSSTIFGASLIAITALVPSYLWCTGMALGLPIFPIFALTYLWTYALQLVNNNPEVTTYSPEGHFFASLTVAGFLALGTFIWFLFVRSSSKPPKYYRAFSGKKGENIFFIFLIINIIFNIARIGGWWNLGNLYSLITGIVLGINTLSIFVLAYRWGGRELSKPKINAFRILLTILILINTVNVLFVGAIVMFILAAIAFIASRRQVPWVTIILVIACFAFLHYGKGEMRHKYWWGSHQHFVQPWEYPGFYAEWFDLSYNKFSEGFLHPDFNSKARRQQTLAERVDLIYLLLMVQKKTPTEVPYLDGATYAIIPQLLVPRVFNKSKLSTFEGIYLLNIHYGLQTRAETAKTTIGWGLINEAYANFGLLGCGVLAVILGVFYGQATRWSMHTPLLSSRSLFSVVLFSLAFQTEINAGVYVTELMQSVVVLLFLNFTLMAVHKVTPPRIQIRQIEQS